MKNNINGNFKLVISLIALFLVLVGDAFGLVMLNDSDGGFPPPNVEATSGNETIRQLVNESASCFFKSYGQFMFFLNEVELGELNGVNFSSLQLHIDAATAYMKTCQNTYNSLNILADSTPYKEDFISRLKEFDYDAFRKEKKLTLEIFEEVKSYLKKGDIKGMYKKALLETQQILDSLNGMKEEVDSFYAPTTDKIWELNNSYYNLTIWGQYSSMIFVEVKRNLNL